MWVRRQTWIQDLLDFWVLLEELGDDHCVAARLFDSDLERLRASEAEPGIEWTNNATSGLHVKVELVIKVGVVEHKCAGHNIGMTSNILGQRMHDNVSAEFGGVL